MEPLNFTHSFNYKDISFGQGNQGFIKYLHDWDITPVSALPATPISTLNLPAEKVYAYERLAPQARRFAILYNTMWRTVEEQLLPFFAFQLHGFYFQHQKIVYDAVFTEAGLPAATMDAIYKDERFGWGKVETFRAWVKLAHQKNRKEMPEY
jgi:hypothetical protein